MSSKNYRKRIKTFVSFGLVAFVIVNKEPLFLLIQRAETIPYILFMTNQINKIKNDTEQVLENMTLKEKYKLLTYVPKQPETRLWCNIQKYRHCLQKEKDVELEWSFPKGRKSKDKHESELNVAKREFQEETIFSINEIDYVFDKRVFTYSVIGSDECEYRYCLYPCIINLSKRLEILKLIHDYTMEQKGNVKNVKLILPHKTQETSNIGFFGINALIREKGMNRELVKFLWNNYSSFASLILRAETISSSPFMASINFS